jgi:hypothetical protein
MPLTFSRLTCGFLALCCLAVVGCDGDSLAPPERRTTLIQLSGTVAWDDGEPVNGSVWVEDYAPGTYINFRLLGQTEPTRGLYSGQFTTQCFPDDKLLMSVETATCHGDLRSDNALYCKTGPQTINLVLPRCPPQ